jgi:hypothetical protein
VAAKTTAHTSSTAMGISRRWVRRDTAEQYRGGDARRTLQLGPAHP